MVLVTMLWSLAGVVTRHLDAARSFEVTFWRSAFNAASLALMLSALRGWAFWLALRQAPGVLLASALCWAVMFTAFMVALTLTTVANVLVTMAFSPLLTALLARLWLKRHLDAANWLAIVMAGSGIAWMFGRDFVGGQSLLGSFVAAAVPLAGALNLILLERAAQRGRDRPAPDMLPAVMLGAAGSALISLPLAWPLQASWHDLGLLAGLGIFQLAVPCLLMVMLANCLPAHEIALLALLEVIFGILWAWLGAGETPSSATLQGGSLVLLALLGLEMRRLGAAPRTN